MKSCHGRSAGSSALRCGQGKPSALPFRAMGCALHKCITLRSNLDGTHIDVNRAW
jgi:hypothetical protein